MNEHETWRDQHDEHAAGARVGTLLRQAAPPVEGAEAIAVVRAGAARGQRLRRRRRQGAAALAAVAVVGVVGGVGLVPGGAARDQAGEAPASQGRESPAGPAAAPQPVQPVRPVQMVRPTSAGRLAGAVESALGGEVRTLVAQDRQGRPLADLTWNGFAMRVFVRPALTGGDGAARCAREGSGRCVAVDEGAADQLTWTGPRQEGGVTGRSVTVFDDRGWDVGITVFNAADSKAGPLLADQPPLTVRELTRAILTGDGWFEPQRRG